MHINAEKKAIGREDQAIDKLCNCQCTRGSRKKELSPGRWVPCSTGFPQ